MGAHCTVLSTSGIQFENFQHKKLEKTFSSFFSSLLRIIFDYIVPSNGISSPKYELEIGDHTNLRPFQKGFCCFSFKSKFHQSRVNLDMRQHSSWPLSQWFNFYLPELCFTLYIHLCQRNRVFTVTSKVLCLSPHRLLHYSTPGVRGAWKQCDQKMRFHLASSQFYRRVKHDEAEGHTQNNGGSTN